MNNFTIRIIDRSTDYLVYCNVFYKPIIVIYRLIDVCSLIEKKLNSNGQTWIWIGKYVGRQTGKIIITT